MTITVTHSTPADGSFSATGATAWNATHSFTGTLDVVNGGTGQTTTTAAINALLPTQATNSGKYLTTDGTNTSWATVSGGGSPGGSTTQVQFNNAGAFGGSANFTWDGTNAQLGATGALRFADSDSSNYVSFKSPATVASNVTWTLPATDGTAGQVLSTNGSGVLSWVDRSVVLAPSSVDYLVVAGGGGGGFDTGGGGGAGGFLTGTSLSVSAGTAYTVTIGAFGAGSGSTSGEDGSNSVFSSITSTGGGGGGTFNAVGRNGGSGGGGGGRTGAAGGTGSQGNNGGASYPGNTGATGHGGGGGGAGAAGTSGSTTGNGGNGTASSITGSSVTYAGGGGGGGYSPNGTAGTGGSGGGGAGGDSPSGTPVAGTTNLGGGGGGGRAAISGGAGANGGSGVVVIAYPNTFAEPTSISGGLTYDQPTRAGYRVYRFTAGTGTITW